MSPEKVEYWCERLLSKAMRYGSKRGEKKLYLADLEECQSIAVEKLFDVLRRESVADDSENPWPLVRVAIDNALSDHAEKERHEREKVRRYIEKSGYVAAAHSQRGPDIVEPEYWDPPCPTEIEEAAERAHEYALLVVSSRKLGDAGRTRLAGRLGLPADVDCPALAAALCSLGNVLDFFLEDGSLPSDVQADHLRNWLLDQEKRDKAKIVPISSESLPKVASASYRYVESNG